MGKFIFSKGFNKYLQVPGVFPGRVNPRRVQALFIHSRAFFISQRTFFCFRGLVPLPLFTGPTPRSYRTSRSHSLVHSVPVPPSSMSRSHPPSSQSRPTPRSHPPQSYLSRSNSSALYVPVPLLGPTPRSHPRSYLFQSRSPVLSVPVRSPGLPFLSVSVPAQPSLSLSHSPVLCPGHTPWSHSLVHSVQVPPSSLSSLVPLPGPNPGPLCPGPTP